MAAMMRKRTDDELKKVKATPAQSKKIHAFQDHMMKVREAFMKANPKMDREARRPVMEKWRAEQTAFLKKTLTGKQYAQWDADMKAARARGGGGGPGGGRGGPGGGGRPGIPPGAGSH